MKTVFLGVLLSFMASLVNAVPLAANKESVLIDATASGQQVALDPKKWGLRNGCVSNLKIRRVKFDSRTTGIIELSHNRKLKITLRNNCSGIRSQGYVHKPINNRFCEGDILRVIEYGNSCVVKSLEPYIEPPEENEAT